MDGYKARIGKEAEIKLESIVRTRKEKEINQVIHSILEDIIIKEESAQNSRICGYDNLCRNVLKDKTSDAICICIFRLYDFVLFLYRIKRRKKWVDSNK